MKPLRRITTPRSGPMRSIELIHICDQCGKHRSHGDHRACSRRRQAANRHKWEGRS